MENGVLRTGAIAQFLADAFVDQHVRVDGHTQRQRHGRDARQSECGLQHGEHRHQQQQVDRQTDGRHHAEEHVVDRHENDDGNEAPGHRVKTLADVLLPQAGADGALFDDVHRRSQGTGAQQQRGVVGFLHGHVAGDLYPAAGDFAADHRGGDDFAASAVEQNHGGALAHVLPRDLLEDAGALGVEGEEHRGLVGLLVEAGLGVGEVVTGQQHVALDHQFAAIAVGKDLVAGGQRALPGQRGLGCGAVIDHAHFE